MAVTQLYPAPAIDCAPGRTFDPTPNAEYLRIPRRDNNGTLRAQIDNSVPCRELTGKVKETRRTADLAHHFLVGCHRT
jgi:hypothetical protein